MIELRHARDEVFPRLEALKRRFFNDHPDEPVILHRKELISRRWPFCRLRDPTVEREFNAATIGLLQDLDYSVGMSRALLKLSGGSVHDYATISADSPSPSRASRARRAATSAGIS